MTYRNSEEKLKNIVGIRKGVDDMILSAWERGYKLGLLDGENSEKIRAYCKESLSKCDEFREKYLKSDREYDRSQARIFEGMAEAYADIIERFFKEADNEQS